MADVDSKYFCNGFPYIGKDDLRPDDVQVTEHVVLKLADPFLNEGRNITADNYFSSMKLAEKLRVAKTSYVGTVNKKRREIPTEVKNSKALLYESQLLKSGSMTLTMYQGKVKKNVLILSSLHPFIDIADNPKKTPETIQFYNATKYGVDVVDQMARQYSTRTAVRRWPLHVFQNTLDLSLINAWICFKEVTKQKISRRNFILKLADELRSTYVSGRRRQNPPEHNSDDTESDDDQPPKNEEKRRRCYKKKCPNKTSQLCKKCKKHVCGKHAKAAKVSCFTCTNN